MERHLFLIETGPLSTHHVEQDAVAGGIALLVQMGCPVLCAQCPSVARIVSGFPLWEAIVLGVETDEVDAQVK